MSREPLGPRYLPVLLLLLAVSAGSGLLAVLRSDHPTGWDGYYYLVQVRTLLSEGEMHSPEYSPVYIPMILFRLLTGSCLWAFRLTAVLARVLFVLSVFVLSRTLVRSWGGGGDEPALTALAAAAMAVMSPSLDFFSAQFPKNLLGFCLLLFFASSVIVLSGRWQRGAFRVNAPGLSVSLLLFAATFLTHRFSAVLAVAFMLLYLVPPVFRGSERRIPAVATAAAALLLAVLTVLSGRIPLAPSLRDLERVTGDLSASPSLVPLEFVRSFGSFRMSLPWLLETGAASLAPVLSAVLLLIPAVRDRVRPGGGYASVLVLSMVGLFPFLEFSLTGLAYRLLFATLLLFPLVCLPWLVGTVRFLRRRSGGRVLPAVGLTAVLAGMSFLTAPSYDPVLHDPPYDRYEEISDRVAELLSGSDFELVVAHRSLAEVITFRHGIDALPWAPEERFTRERVWRVTAGVMRGEFAWYLGSGAMDSLYRRLPGDYALLREDAWESFLEGIAGDPALLEAVGTWRNPMDVRPGYLVGDSSRK
ncbi:MAG: hypothetical protein AVO35_11265 [Candidatus Aegiribacteria sp. MLS_C]|nr:MAG: hypothetical protein AVO35_11265 [Candidatus Aegiribacteria sp. MLS_C]